MSFSMVQFADLEFAYDDPDGIARFVRTVQSHSDDPSLVVGAGDNVAPSALSLCSGTTAVQPVFDACAVNFDTLGNHDFDYGTDVLTAAIDSSPQQFLCANVFDAAGDRFGTDVGVRPWTTTEIDGLRLGLFGLANPLTAEKSPPASELTVTDPIEAATETIATLHSQNVDEIVCLAHLGDQEDHGQGEVDALAAGAAIDVICDGHTHGHPRLDHVADTLIARTTGNGQDVNVLTYDGAWTANRVATDKTTPATDIETTYRRMRSELGLAEIVGTADPPIERSIETTYCGESRLGNFVADAYRWASGAAIGLQHSPGMRPGEDLSGEITVGDLVGIVPFDMAVVVVSMTGTQLLRALEYGGEYAYPDHPGCWLLHTSGAQLTYDFEERSITALSVGGEPVDDTSEYTVAAPENCIDWFPDEYAVRQRLDRQYELLAAYARDSDIDPRVTDRLTLCNQPVNPSA